MGIPLAFLGMALAALGVAVVHESGRYAFARLVRLRLGQVWLRVLAQLPGPGRAGARLGAVAAGLAAAYVAVAAFGLAYFSCHGVPTGDGVIVVAEVLDGQGAAGTLRRGDRIIAVDGEPITMHRMPPLSERVAAKGGAPVRLTLRRAGVPLDVTVQPTQIEPGGPWLLDLVHGAEPEVETGAATAVAAAVRAPIARARAVIADYVNASRSEGDPDPVGPVRLVDELRGTADPPGRLAWKWALAFASYALLVLALLDLLRAAAIGIERLRDRGDG